MAIRVTWVLATLVGAIALVAVVRGCSGGGDRLPEDVASAPPAGEARSAVGEPGRSAADAARAAAAKRRDAALQSAVDTLQRYLAALGADDKAEADAYWAGGRVPARSGEADLRSLQALRAVRIENGTPVPLDSEVVPAAVEIPVKLRVSRKSAALKRYAGHYRLRRAISGDRWEITSARIDALPPQR